MTATALVTGGTGFLGQALARRLRDGGWTVAAMGRNARVGAQLAAEGIAFVQADLTDLAAVRRACAGQNVVFHSGALSAPWGAYEAFYQANVVGTYNVAEASLSAGVGRLVHVSTPSLYFDGRDREGIKEADPLPARSVNAYAETKRLAEQMVDDAAARGLKALTIRPRGIFGPGDTTILPRLVKANAAGRLPLFDGGRARIDLTYVENVVDALLACARAPEAALGAKYNITNGEPITVGELLPRVFAAIDTPFRPTQVPSAAGLAAATAMEAWARATNGPEPLLTAYAVGLLSKHQTLDLTQARARLGYEPRVPLEDGIQAFAAWWKQEHRP
jgi:nucleoside-diphosphate-sugar epimerase